MFKKILLSIILIFINFSAFAGGISEIATVKSIGSGSFYNNACGFNCVVVSVVPAPTGSTPCGYSNGWHVAIDLDSAEGSTQVSTVLAAHAAGREISIAGDDVCTADFDMERVRYIFTR